MRRYALILLILELSGPFRSVAARGDSPQIDSLKNQIQQLVNGQEYGLAAKAYERLGWLYHQQFGYNKYTVDAYLNGLNYYGMAGDSLGFYNQHLVIGDYYTHDYFMQSPAEKYLNKALRFFTRTGNYPKLIECRLGLANIAQKAEQIPKTLLTELRETERMSARFQQPYFQAFAQNLLANAYSRAKKPDSAQYFA